MILSVFFGSSGSLLYDEYEEMQMMAEATASVSHNHPEGIKGAVVTATCVWMARHGKTKQEIYDYVLEQYPKESYEYSIGEYLLRIVWGKNKTQPKRSWGKWTINRLIQKG